MNFNLGDIQWEQIWQNAVNVLASISPLLAAFIGIGLAMEVGFALKALLSRKKDDGWF